MKSLDTEECFIEICRNSYSEYIGRIKKLLKRSFAEIYLWWERWESNPGPSP